MAKAKIQFEKQLQKKFIVACDINDVKIVKEMQAGEITVCEVNFKHPSQLFAVGRMIDKVSESYETKPIEAIKKDTEKPAEKQAEKPAAKPAGKK